MGREGRAAAGRPEGRAAGGAEDGALLAVDVGNTVTRFGIFSGADLTGSLSVTTPARLTADEANMRTGEALRALGVADDGSGLSGVVLSCVVPALSDAWAAALRRLSPTRPLVVGPGVRSGLRMRFDDPAEVGPDRIADVVAARELLGAPVVAIGLGTSTNFEVVDASGTFVGGIVTPGLALGAASLAEAAARLPSVELRPPARVIGRNTRAAMQSGLVFGEVARIDGLLDAIARELGAEAPVVVSGEGARLVAPLLAHEAAVDDELTLRGLRLLWERNRG
ncbi:MAG: type III pantothenate kinase [Atopobiaceae bacterium]|nr:type III pantothenate kinase [Atopobiaceae bacterium]